MWYEADIDAMMTRTLDRPIPQGRIAPGEALGFGCLLAVFSVVTMGLMVNLLSAALLAFTIFFYAVVYTMWLKRWTPQNIVIGGAAGAFPPVIGWAAATGSVALEPILMFLIIFFWTPPHFWALALLRADDYARAGIPMLPVVVRRARNPPPDPALFHPAGADRRAALAAWLCRRCFMARRPFVGGALMIALSVRLLHGREKATRPNRPQRQLFALLDPLSVRSLRRPAGRAGHGSAASCRVICHG